MELDTDWIATMSRPTKWVQGHCCAADRHHAPVPHPRSRTRFGWVVGSEVWIVGTSDEGDDDELSVESRMNLVNVFR